MHELWGWEFGNGSNLALWTLLIPLPKQELPLDRGVVALISTKKFVFLDLSSAVSCLQNLFFIIEDYDWK